MKALPQQRGRIRLGLAALAAIAALTVPQVAQAAPSEDDIAKAQAAEEAAKLSVAEIEVRLAQVSAQAQSATQAAQMAGEDLNAANIALGQARATADQAQAVIGAMRAGRYGEDAAVIGTVEESRPERGHKVLLETGFGSRRILDMLVGEQLPRIC